MGGERTIPSNPGIATRSLADMLRPDDKAHAEPAADAIAPIAAITDCLNASLPADAKPLVVRALELHLVRAFGTADLGNGPETVVISEPEFLWVADVGLPARAGVLIHWEAGLGYGVPGFPDFSKAELRSISGSAARDFIYPNKAGDWLGALEPGTDPAAAKAAIEQIGAFDVNISGTFVAGRCHPFAEAEFCAMLAAKLAFVRFAHPNRIVRLIDFSPGWDVRQLV